MQAAVKKSKGAQTRELILSTALRLFRERGYEATTMRVIAEEAGVALGNAYYYFRSKEDLVQGFYEQLQADQMAASEAILLTEKSLKHRLSNALRAHFAVTAPYQRMMVSLFTIAADPDSPLSPFGEETRPIREASIARYAQLVSGTQEKLPEDLQQELPELLWLYHMGLVLFWLYDRSPGFVRTYKLIELSSDLVSNLIILASNPVMTPVRKMILQFLKNFRSI